MLTPKTAIKILLVLHSLVILFQVLVLLQILPYHIVWAGKINTKEQMFGFMSVSILINVLLILILLIKWKNITNNTSNKIINGLIWAFVLIFALNTIGNLFSESWIELIFGTTLTIISSFLCWRIVKE